MLSLAACSGSSSKQHVTATPTPKLTGPSVLQDPSSVVVLPGSRIVVGDYRAGTLSVFDIGHLRRGLARAEPAFSLSGPAVSGPQGMDLCPNGTLWVANYTGDNVEGFTVAGGK